MLNDLLKDSGLKKLNFKFEGAKLGEVLSSLLNIILFIAAFWAFYYFVWGAWAYIFASGEKESLAKARLRIRWALTGLVVIFMAYFIIKYAQEIFPARGGLPF